MVIPLIGLGTWPLRGRECTQTVQMALELGYRHIDTAQFYENEEAVGEAIRSSGIPRKDLFIVTKIRRESFHSHAIKSVEQSLERLGTDYVDALLIHDCFDGIPIKAMMWTLTECKRLGYARMIGVSNFTPAEMAEASGHADIEVRQDRFHAFMEAPTDGIPLIAYSPLANLKAPRLLDMAQRHGKTPAQIALRWITQQGIAAIPKSSDRDRLKENLESLNFELESPDQTFGTMESSRLESLN